jgi:hypothetical protein
MLVVLRCEHDLAKLRSRDGRGGGRKREGKGSFRLPWDSTLPYFWTLSSGVGVLLNLQLNDVVVTMIWYRELRASLKIYL